MCKIKKYIKSKLSMKKIENKKPFYDVISGKDVFYYKDCYGVEWMAHSKYGFRVKKFFDKETQTFL